MAYKHNCKPHGYVSLFHNLHDINRFALFDVHVVSHDHELWDQQDEKALVWGFPVHREDLSGPP